MNVNWTRGFVLAGFGLAAAAQAAPTGFSRQKQHLDVPATIGGIAVQAGDIEVFQPGGTLAKGVLQNVTLIQKLTLLPATEVSYESPGRLAEAKLPAGEPTWIAGAPLRAGTLLRFGYNKWLQNLRGVLAYNPGQYSAFQSGGVNNAVLQNDVNATCSASLGSNEPRWNCRYSAQLGSAIDQTFGVQRVTFPRGTRIGFSQWGLDFINLAEDTDLIGLPVSAAFPIRINRYSTGGSPVIVGLHLAQNATYLGIPLSNVEEVEFYDPDSQGVSHLSAFAPQGDLRLRAAGQEVIVAPLRTVHLNRDGSLRYGILATAQRVQNIVIPENAIVFFGETATDPISSIGLQGGTSVIVDGITYTSQTNHPLFLDFDSSGKVARVRGI